MKEKSNVKIIFLRVLAATILIPELIIVGMLIQNVNKGGMFRTMDVVILTSIICIPLFISGLLINLSIGEREKRYKVVRIYLFIVFIGYLAIATNMLFFGFRNNFAVANIGRSHKEYLIYHSNFMPFHTVVDYIKAWKFGTLNRGIVLANLFGNLVILAPLGILLPCIFIKLRSWNRFFVVILLTAIFIEGSQFLFMIGTCDIDDVILNLFGALVAFALWKSKPLQLLSIKVYIMYR